MRLTNVAILIGAGVLLAFLALGAMGFYDPQAPSAFSQGGPTLHRPVAHRITADGVRH